VPVAQSVDHWNRPRLENGTAHWQLGFSERESLNKVQGAEMWTDEFYISAIKFLNRFRSTVLYLGDVFTEEIRQNVYGWRANRRNKCRCVKAFGVLALHRCYLQATLKGVLQCIIQHADVGVSGGESSEIWK